jgi:hypothetical protein
MAPALLRRRHVQQRDHGGVRDPHGACPPAAHRKRSGAQGAGAAYGLIQETAEAQARVLALHDKTAAARFLAIVATLGRHDVLYEAAEKAAAAAAPKYNLKVSPERMRTHSLDKLAAFRERR